MEENMALATAAPRKSVQDIRDLRDWLQVIDDIGELQHVRGADPHLEIGGISDLNYRRKPSAALLFDDIKGYPSGYRILTGSLTASRRVGVALRAGTNMTDQDLVEACRGKPNEWELRAAEFEPTVVDSAPLYDNVYSGDEASLARFPSPLWHEHDGGRYVGTGCIVLTNDPERGDVNGGAYRMMIRDNGQVTVNPVPGKHGWLHIQKWLQREGRAPVAVSFGHDPLLHMVAATEVPTGISEINYAGAMIGRPLEVVRGELTGLPIPASSEIAVEGWVYPNRVLPEAPTENGRATTRAATWRFRSSWLSGSTSATTPSCSAHLPASPRTTTRTCGR